MTWYEFNNKLKPLFLMDLVWTMILIIFSKVYLPQQWSDAEGQEPLYQYLSLSNGSNSSSIWTIHGRIIQKITRLPGMHLPILSL